jgi:hypothetical protein
MKNFIVSRENALQNLTPNAKYTWRGLEYSGLEWHDEDQTKPTAEAITTELARLEAEWTANEYARNRQAEYPEWGTQLNKIYDDGLTKWKAEMVDPIKAKYPKP